MRMTKSAQMTQKPSLKMMSQRLVTSKKSRIGFTIKNKVISTEIVISMNWAQRDVDQIQICWSQSNKASVEIKVMTNISQDISQRFSSQKRTPRDSTGRIRSKTVQIAVNMGGCALGLFSSAHFAVEKSTRTKVRERKAACLVAKLMAVTSIWTTALEVSAIDAKS